MTNRNIISSSSYTKDELLNINSLQNTLNNLLPKENREDNENYADLLADLTNIKIVTVNQLEQIIQKHWEKVKEKDRKMVNDDTWSRDPKRKSKGVFYSHTGLIRVALEMEFGNEEFEKAMRIDKLDQLIVRLYELQKERDPLESELENEDASLKDRIASLEDRLAFLKNRYSDKEKEEIEGELEDIKKKQEEWYRKHERLKAINGEIEKLIEGSGENRDALVGVIAVDEYVRTRMARFNNEIGKWKKDICKLNTFGEYAGGVFDKIWEEIRRKIRDTEEKSLEDLEKETDKEMTLRDLIPRIMVAIFLNGLGYEEELRKLVVRQGGKEIDKKQIPDRSILIFLIKKIYEEKSKIVHKKWQKGTLKPGPFIMGNRVLGEIFEDDGVFGREDRVESRGTGILRILYEEKKREVEEEYKKKGEKFTNIDLFNHTRSHLIQDLIPLFSESMK